MNDWFGDPPADWTIAPLGNYFSERREVGSAEVFPALSVTKDGVVEQLADVAKSADTEQRRVVRKGDFAINSWSDRKGSAGVAPRDGSVSVITIVLQPRGIEGAFAHYLLRSEPFQEEFFRFGTGIVADLWSTRWSAMKAIKVALPTKAAQRSIAAYLDCETAEIDAFIADQEQLIALLNERRRALVVDELDRIAAVSGVVRRRVGESVTIISGYPFDAGRFGDVGRPLLRIRDLNQAAATVRYPDSDFPPSVVVTDADVLIGMDGDFNVGRWRGEEAGLLNQRMLALRSKEGHLLRWLEYVLPPVLNRLNDLTYSTTVKHLAVGQVRSASFERPQDDVALVSSIARMDAVTASIDATVADAREAIFLSKERRAALISAAVTGRIELTERKWVLV